MLTKHAAEPTFLPAARNVKAGPSTATPAYHPSAEIRCLVAQAHQSATRFPSQESKFWALPPQNITFPDHLE